MQEESIMKVTKRVQWLLALSICGGCAAEAPAPESNEVAANEVAASEQAVSLFDCQGDLVRCIGSARGIRGLAECTTNFTTCNAQAAQDLLDQQNILTDCRASADTCLRSAITAGDIRACRGIYTTCAQDAIETAAGVLDTAIDTAQDAIDQTFDTAHGLIGTALGFTGDAFGVLDQCRADATHCIEAATTTARVSECKVIFDGCASDAVDLVDSLLP
jgi:hypothetical protein